jgi:Flp pilus assembly protein CpaB
VVPPVTHFLGETNLKRSNRLVLLVGVFLAIVAFVGILVLVRGGGTGSNTPPPPPTTGPVVVASVDIPLSTRIRADQVTTKVVDLAAITPGAFIDPSQVIGQVVRQPVAAGAQITGATIGATSGGVITTVDCPATLRCMSVQVDQVTGVGTVIKTGDYVDMVVGFNNFPVITTSPTDNSVTVVTGLNSLSVKLLLQGMQVMGTLLPPPETTTTEPAPAPSGSPAPTTGGSTALNGQQEIVILAVTAQQAEVLKFAQMDGAGTIQNVSLALRAVGDFIDPVTGAPLPPVDTQTTGVTLKVLVDNYGVLPPEVIQTVTPTASRRP